VISKQANKPIAIFIGVNGSLQNTFGIKRAANMQTTDEYTATTMNTAMGPNIANSSTK